ncbi:hypothetical protein [Piscinibacter koreensis]|uniref:Uncharacterized protein n=1 Tax=Piscinibacter koreensis TaxID=2742824 RepID=A0A7Y6NLT1_9BURK|nr:hypothetical protein [Schlegelella koreensis]NUZ05502.1 hypothetical protein [Schlegelella koreensis]
MEWAEEQGGTIEVRSRQLPYCVILSQDCDLEHDYNQRQDSTRADNDKYLLTLLLAPAYPAEIFREGAHLQEQDLKMQRINSTAWKQLTQNGMMRYHFLTGRAELQVPDLVIDFKSFLTTPREVLYRPEFASNYLVTLEVIFREHLSGRFAHYLSRIGLPDFSSP